MTKSTASFTHIWAVQCRFSYRLKPFYRVEYSNFIKFIYNQFPGEYIVYPICHDWFIILLGKTNENMSVGFLLFYRVCFLNDLIEFQNLCSLVEYNYVRFLKTRNILKF